MADGDLNQKVSLSVSAPGKVILHGEHSVVYGKLALAASLSLRTRLALQETDDSDRHIRLLLPDIDIVFSLDTDKLNQLLNTQPLLLNNAHTCSDFNWHKPDLINKDRFLFWVKDCLLKGEDWNTGQLNALLTFHFMLLGMLAGVDVAVEPFELHIVSDLTIGAGLGSSASYSVCLAASLFQYAKTKVIQAGRVGRNIAREGYLPCKITSSDVGSLDAEERDLIERWARVGDGIMHGTASGVDSATVTAGGVVEFRKPSESRPQPHFANVLQTTSLRIVLVDSGVTRNTKRMVGEVKSLRDRLPGVVEAILEAMDEVALAVRALLAQTNSTDHIGELVELNHHLLQALGVSHPTLDDICRTAKKHGFSGKLTGAGGGGYALILLPPNSSPENVAVLLADLSSKGYQPVVTSLGGAGVEVGTYQDLQARVTNNKM